MKTRKSKNRIAIFMAIMSFVMLFVGTLAFFTDREVALFSGDAGTVLVDADYSKIDMLDEDFKNILNPGDSRNLGFSVKSEGSKSMMVRNIITLTSSKPMTEVNGICEYEIFNAQAVKFVEGQGYLPASEKTKPLATRELSEDKMQITYVTDNLLLSGNSDLGDENREIEYVEGEKGSEGEIWTVPDTHEYDYKFVMRADASNEYQDTTVSINIVTEAVQYRNNTNKEEPLFVVADSAVFLMNGFMEPVTSSFWGFKPSTNTDNANPNERGELVAEAAKTYIGVPYAFAGTSYTGVDAAGLVVAAHNAIGVTVPKSASAIGNGGESIAKADALPGDVVCYAGNCGIYIGDGQMVVAGKMGQVAKISNVSSNCWYRRYWTPVEEVPEETPDVENMTKLTYSVVDEGIQITGLTSEYKSALTNPNVSKELVIPDTIDGLPVISVSSTAIFSNLTKLTLPATVTSFAGQVNSSTTEGQRLEVEFMAEEYVDLNGTVFGSGIKQFTFHFGTDALDETRLNTYENMVASVAEQTSTADFKYVLLDATITAEGTTYN